MVDYEQLVRNLLSTASLMSRDQDPAPVILAVDVIRALVTDRDYWKGQTSEAEVELCKQEEELMKLRAEIAPYRKISAQIVADFAKEIVSERPK